MTPTHQIEQSPRLQQLARRYAEVDRLLGAAPAMSPDAWRRQIDETLRCLEGYSGLEGYAGLEGYSDEVVGYNPASDANLVAWYREDVTDTGGDDTADEWLDKTGNGYHGVLIGAAVAAPITASDANFNGHQSLSFQQSGDLNCFQVSAGAIADWKFLHDGTGAYGAVAFRSNGTASRQPFLATCDRSSTDIGLVFEYDGTDKSLRFAICDGSGTFLVTVQSATDSVALNTTHWLTFRHKSGETNEFEVYLNGSLLLSGDYGATPSTSNPTAKLVLGSEAPIFTRQLKGWMADAFVGQGYPDMTDINAYGTTRYGL